ncbi:MAG TPA: response regulator [Polyangiaceae bacterium]
MPERQLPTVTHALADDRQSIAPGDRVLLVIEDDETFGRTLLDFVRGHGFRGIVAPNGQQGLELARTLKPDAITLDLRLPDMDGWVVLDPLKHDTRTRHIPVHIISGTDEEHRGLGCGALAFVRKPTDSQHIELTLGEIKTFLDRRVKQVLIVEDDDVQRKSLVELIGDEDVVTTAVLTAEAALAALKDHVFDCMVLDLKLPGMPGVDLIRAVRDQLASRRMPIIIYTGMDLSDAERADLARIRDDHREGRPVSGAPAR